MLFGSLPSMAWRLLPLLLLSAPVGAATTITTTKAFDYDSSGRVVKSMVEPGDSDLCLVTELTYDDYGRSRKTTVRNCNGSAPALTGAVTEAPAPASSSLAVIEPRTVKREYSTDQRFLATTTNALDEALSATYDGRFGGLTSEEDPNKISVSWAYDGLGRKTLETRADGTKTKLEYVYCNNATAGSGQIYPTPAGAATAACEYVLAHKTMTGGGGTSISPIYYVQSTPMRADGKTVNGPYVRVYFDTLGREIRSETQGFDGEATSRIIWQDTQYDRGGRVAAKSLPYFRGESVTWANYEYDVLGRIVNAVEPGPTGMVSTATAYEGLSTTVTDPQGNRRTQTRNVAGQVSTITDAKSGVLEYSYDPSGRLVQTKDAKGNVISAVYDLHGRKTALYDPDLGVWNYAYNAVGDLVYQKDAKGQKTTMTYDKLGRMIGRSEPDLRSDWYYSQYADKSACKKGLLCETTAGDSFKERYEYDSAGRLINTARTLGTSVYVAGVAYDADSGRVSTQTYPTKLQVRPEYTPLGYLWKLIDQRNGNALWTANSLNALGQDLKYSYGNGTVTTNAFYADGSINVTSATGPGGVVQDISYSFDQNRNITARLDALTHVTASYTYDELNRLTSETRWGGSLASSLVMRWGYDAIGNMITRMENGQTNTYNYNTSGTGSRQPHAVASVSGDVNGRWVPSYSYDPNGNLTQGAGRSVEWTSYNKAQNITMGSTRLELLYDSEHQRTQQSHFVNGAFQRKTIYMNPAGGAGLYYEEETGAAGSKKTHYVSAGGATVASIVCTADPCTTIENTKTQYWHADHLGSVSVITNEVGVVVERLAYEPFGKRRYSSGATDIQGTLGAVSTARGFTEHEHLDEIGLVNMNGRIYDPALGRFLSADPGVPHTRDMQSFNRYSYTRNNPIGGMDVGGYEDTWGGGSDEPVPESDWGLPSPTVRDDRDYYYDCCWGTKQPDGELYWVHADGTPTNGNGVGLEKVEITGSPTSQWLKDWNSVTSIFRSPNYEDYTDRELYDEIGRSGAARAEYIERAAKRGEVVSPTAVLVDFHKEVAKGVGISLVGAAAVPAKVWEMGAGAVAAEQAFARAVAQRMAARAEAEAVNLAAKAGTEGASGTLTTASGGRYLGNSTGSSASGGTARAPMNPTVQEALNVVKNPSRSHGACCEIDAANKALNAGDSVRGAKMGPVYLNNSGRILPACSTCREVMKILGIE